MERRHAASIEAVETPRPDDAQLDITMIALSDLPELVQDYESGDLLWSAAYPSLLHLLGEHDVEVILEGLSSELASRFKESLRAEFSDEYWAEHGLWIDNAGGEPPNRSQIVARIRAWLRKDFATTPGKSE